MSRRSRKSGSAISLFFFQDIIMSTSGIMIMIVLLLCLELIERPEVSAASAESPIQKLQEDVDKIQLEIEILERQIQATSELIQAASQMSPSERSEQVQHLQTANNFLSLELERLQSQMSLHERKESERNARRQELNRLRGQIETAERDQASLTNVLRDETEDNRPLFSLSHGDRREGWIVDVSDSAIQVAPIGRIAKPQTFVLTRAGTFRSELAADMFLAWARSKSVRPNAYYFLFIRPDGVNAFQAVSESFNKAGVSYGYDIADSKQKLLHPERGAGE